MIQEYLAYNEATRAVLDKLRSGDDPETMIPLMDQRERLFRKFEHEGWPDSEKAAAILQDTLKLERECMKNIAVMRTRLKDEINRLHSKKYALQRYNENTLQQ